MIKTGNNAEHFFRNGAEVEDLEGKLTSEVEDLGPPLRPSLGHLKSQGRQLLLKNIKSG